MKRTFCTMIAAVLAMTALAFAQSAPLKKAVSTKGDIENTLMHYENDMLEQFHKKDFTAFKKRIMAGAWSIDENEPVTIEDLIKQAMDPKANLTWNYKVSDMKVVDLDANAKAVTYTVDETGSMMGQPFPPRVYATTIWANHGGNWMAVFHQESTAVPAAKK